LFLIDCSPLPVGEGPGNEGYGFSVISHVTEQPVASVRVRTAEPCPDAEIRPRIVSVSLVRRNDPSGWMGPDATVSPVDLEIVRTPFVVSSRSCSSNEAGAPSHAPVRFPLLAVMLMMG
jgi:hypothetical protein